MYVLFNSTHIQNSKTFPPKFDSSITYPAIYNLDELDIYQEAESGVYFNIQNLPDILSFGKHYFTLSFNDP